MSGAVVLGLYRLHGPVARNSRTPSANFYDENVDLIWGTFDQ